MWEWRRPHLDVVVLIEGEAVVDAGGQHDHVALAAVDADPTVLRVPDIKVSCAPRHRLHMRAAHVNAVEHARRVHLASAAAAAAGGVPQPVGKSSDASKTEGCLGYHLGRVLSEGMRDRCGLRQ